MAAFAVSLVARGCGDNVNPPEECRPQVELPQACRGHEDVPQDCRDYCCARQINIAHCAAKDGHRGLRETFDECISGARNVDFTRCIVGPSCAGWLLGCISDVKPLTSAASIDPASCSEWLRKGRFGDCRVVTP